MPFLRHSAECMYIFPWLSSLIVFFTSLFSKNARSTPFQGFLGYNSLPSSSTALNAFSMALFFISKGWSGFIQIRSSPWANTVFRDSKSFTSSCFQTNTNSGLLLIFNPFQLQLLNQGPRSFSVEGHIAIVVVFSSWKTKNSVSFCWVLRFSDGEQCFRYWSSVPII